MGEIEADRATAALLDPRTGTYFDESTMQYRCLAVVPTPEDDDRDEAVIELGRYSRREVLAHPAGDEEDAKREIERLHRMWEPLVEASFTELSGDGDV